MKSIIDELKPLIDALQPIVRRPKAQAIFANHINLLDRLVDDLGYSYVTLAEILAEHGACGPKQPYSAQSLCTYHNRARNKTAEDYSKRSRRPYSISNPATEEANEAPKSSGDAPSPAENGKIFFEAIQAAKNHATQTRLLRRTRPGK